MFVCERDHVSVCSLQHLAVRRRGSGSAIQLRRLACFGDEGSDELARWPRARCPVRRRGEHLHKPKQRSTAGFRVGISDAGGSRSPLRWLARLAPLYGTGPGRALAFWSSVPPHVTLFRIADANPCSRCNRKRPASTKASSTCPPKSTSGQAPLSATFLFLSPKAGVEGCPLAPLRLALPSPRNLRLGRRHAGKREGECLLMGMALFASESSPQERTFKRKSPPHLLPE